MEPLLQIKAIPISIEYKINKARFEAVNTQASVEISGGSHGLKMQMKPLKLKLDRVETGFSSDEINTKYVAENFTKNGVKVTYEAKNSYTEESENMLNISIMDNPIPEIAIKKFSSDVSFNLGTVSPINNNEISWEPQELTIRYEMDKLNFDWNIKRPEMNFIPGNIEFIIKEYPRLEINYIGKPIYVPASADPDYKPIDTFAWGELWILKQEILEI